MRQATGQSLIGRRFLNGVELEPLTAEDVAGQLYELLSRTKVLGTPHRWEEGQQT
jgi:hypothetical protein